MIRTTEMVVDVHRENEPSSLEHAMTTGAGANQPVRTSTSDITPIDGNVLNSTLKNVQEEANKILSSPNIVHKRHASLQTDHAFDITEASLYNKLLEELSSLIKARMDKAEDDLECKIEAIIDAKYLRTVDNSILNNSTSNRSFLEKSMHPAFPSPKNNPLHVSEGLSEQGHDQRGTDQMQTSPSQVKNGVIDANLLKKDFTKLSNDFKDLQEKLALEKIENEKRIADVENTASQNAEDIASDHQYVRRETIEFHGLPIESTYQKPENTYQII